MEATIQKNKEEISFEGAEWKILIGRRIQSHLKITGCDSIRLTAPHRLHGFDSCASFHLSTQ